MQSICKSTMDYYMSQKFPFHPPFLWQFPRWRPKMGSSHETVQFDGLAFDSMHSIIIEIPPRTTNEFRWPEQYIDISHWGPHSAHTHTHIFKSIYSQFAFPSFFFVVEFFVCGKNNIDATCTVKNFGRSLFALPHCFSSNVTCVRCPFKQNAIISSQIFPRLPMPLSPCCSLAHEIVRWSV